MRKVASQDIKLVDIAFEQNLRVLNERREAANKMAKLVADDVDLAKQIHDESYAALAPLIEENRKLNAQLKKIIATSRYAMIEKIAKEKLDAIPNEKKGFYADLDYAQTLSGVLSKQDYLEASNITPEFYEKGLEDNPLILLAEFRNIIEGKVQEAKSNYINSIPIDFQLMDKAKGKDRTEIFRAILLRRLQDLEEDIDLMRNRKVRAVIEMREPWLKGDEYIFQMLMLYESLWDGTVGIFRGTDKSFLKLLEEIKTKRNELEAVENSIGFKKKEEALLDSGLEIKKREDAILDNKLRVKKEELEEAMKKKVEELPEPEEDEEDSGEEG